MTHANNTRVKQDFTRQDHTNKPKQYSEIQLTYNPRIGRNYMKSN